MDIERAPSTRVEDMPLFCSCPRRASKERLRNFVVRVSRRAPRTRIAGHHLKSEAETDAIHFFGHSAPWWHQCAQCVAAGRACTARHASYSANSTKKALEACVLPRLLAAQRVWWRELMVELPRPARLRANELLAYNASVALC